MLVQTLARHCTICAQKNRIRIKKLHGKFRNRGIAQRKNARSSWNVQKMGARRVGRVALTPSRAPPPLAGATPLTPPGAHQAARVQAGRASARCEVEGARGDTSVPDAAVRGRGSGSRRRAAAAPPPHAWDPVTGLRSRLRRRPPPAWDAARFRRRDLEGRDWIRFCVGWVGVGPSGCFRRGSRVPGGVSANGGGVGLRGGSWWVGPEVVGWFGSVVAEWADLMWLGVECYSTPRV